MKPLSSLLLVFSIILIQSCSLFEDEDKHTINGKLQRAVNGEGIPDQLVTIMTVDWKPGLFGGSRILIDSVGVITDSDGNFSADLFITDEASIESFYEGNDEYFSHGGINYFSLDEPIIMQAEKWVKFEITVQNKNPFDENDFIEISLYECCGSTNERLIDIENLGIQNDKTTYNPASWSGVDVISKVSYIAPESNYEYKILWDMVKNGIESSGITDEIPFTVEGTNRYTFEY